MILLATTTMMATAVPSTDFRRAQNTSHIVRVSMNLSNERAGKSLRIKSLTLRVYVCWLSYHILRTECMMMHRLDRNICRQNFGTNRILASYKSFDGLYALLVHIQNRQKAFSVRYLLMLMPFCVVVNTEFSEYRRWISLVGKVSRGIDRVSVRFSSNCIITIFWEWYAEWRWKYSFQFRQNQN